MGLKLEESWKEKIEFGKKILSIKGKELLKLKYKVPFANAEGVVVATDYVSMEDGTGLVHTAPGHGPDDFSAALKHGLKVICPVDSKGNYYKEEAFSKEIGVKKLNKEILIFINRLSDLMFILARYEDRNVPVEVITGQRINE